MTLESRYRRLLRWYPRRWRARDGDVLLGTLLDAAEAAGRRRPSTAEAASIALHGLAERADRRAAVTTASVATVISAAGAVAFLLPVTIGAWNLGAPTALLLLVVDPPLLLVAGAALLHRAGLIGARTTIALPIGGVLAGLTGATTSALLGLGFDAADDGRAVPGWTTTATFAAFGAAWLTIAVLLAAVLLAVLRPATGSLALRLVPAVVVGVVGAPAIGIAFLQPGGPFVCAGGVLAAALLVGRPRIERAQAPRVRSRRRSDPMAVTLAAIGTAAALLAAAFCFTGGPLGVFGLNGTGAMDAGLGLGALAGLPVLAAAVRSTEPPPPLAAVALASAGLLATAAMHLPGPFSIADGAIWPALVAGGLLAAAFAVVVAARMPGPRPTRILLAVLCAAGLLVCVGLVMTIAVGFVVPVAGVVVMVRARRSRALRSATPA